MGSVTAHLLVQRCRAAVPAYKQMAGLHMQVTCQAIQAGKHALTCVCSMKASVVS